MKKLFIVLAILSLVVTAAGAKLRVDSPVYGTEGPGRANTLFFYDDIEGDVSAWGATDFSAGAAPHFHWDTYMAFSGQSWWCGNFDYDADGGYGNSWDDRLNIPATDLTGATYPILTYAFRHDSEAGYDYTYVQAESLGTYVNLKRGYNGKAGWTDIGIYGFILVPYDNPLKARFRFLSDGAWSDEDGLYASTGGGFACDNVKVFDYFTGYVYFYDSEPGAREQECIPTVPAASGDYWHIISRLCPAYSDPHSWWCGDDADTNLIPPNLQDALFTPIVPVYAASCTVFAAVHFGIPTVDNDYCVFYGFCDGGYYGMYSYWGDFEQCNGWGTSGFAGYDVGQFSTPPHTSMGYAWVMYTTDNGCGPAVNGAAGITIDDVIFAGEPWPTAVEESSWGSIKSMYRQ
jgi:hypothetical protein